MGRGCRKTNPAESTKATQPTGQPKELEHARWTQQHKGSGMAFAQCRDLTDTRAAVSAVSLHGRVGGGHGDAVDFGQNQSRVQSIYSSSSELESSSELDESDDEESSAGAGTVPPAAMIAASAAAAAARFFSFRLARFLRFFSFFFRFFSSRLSRRASSSSAARCFSLTAFSWK